MHADRRNYRIFDTSIFNINGPITLGADTFSLEEGQPPTTPSKSSSESSLVLIGSDGYVDHEKELFLDADTAK